MKKEEEIKNADGSRNWQANILLDNIKRLEQENRELKEKIKKYSAINEQDTKDYAILRNALEEIKEVCNKYFSLRYAVSCIPPLAEIENKINKVL